MKRVRFSRLQLKEGHKLSSSEKRTVVGGASAEIKVQCWCGDNPPAWYAGCHCPSENYIVMSDLPEECMDDLF